MLTRGDKAFLGLMMVGWIVAVALAGAGIYVVVHFVMKYW